MLIEKVSLVNWGPYYQENTVDLSVSEDAPVIVVQGLNGFGKTKFIDALKWVFAGSVYGGFDVRDYLNRQSLLEGNEFETSVKIIFSSNGTKYELSRTVKVNPSVLTIDEEGVISSDRDVTFDNQGRVRLAEEGNVPFTDNVSKVVIQRLFPQRLVDFYFFDAAILHENFGQIGKNSQSISQVVRDSVETAMGISGVDSFGALLSQVTEKFRLEMTKDAKDRDQTARLENERRKVFGEIERVSQDVKDLETRAATVQADSASAKAKLRSQGRFVEVQVERDNAAKQIETLENQLNKSREALIGSMDSAWAVPMKEKLRENADSQRARLEEKEAARDKLASLRSKISNLEAQKKSSFCSACERPLENVNLDELEKKILDAKSELDASDQMFQSTFGTGEGVHGYVSGFLLSREFQDAERTLQNSIAEQARLIIELTAAKNKYRQADLTLKNVGDVDFIALQAAAEDLADESVQINKDLSAKKALIDSKQKELEKVDKQLQKLGGSGSPAKSFERAQKLEKALERASNELRARVRTEIEREANSILDQLVSEEDSMHSLLLGSDYELETTKSNPNAAFMQQVFLSFLFAIPRVAKASLPTVIDSPIQHLDEGNRERFTRWLSSGLRQVVLLPHDAEIRDLEDATSIFDERLAGFFELESINKNHSEIRQHYKRKVG